jgi:hypothetical protein
MTGNKKSRFEKKKKQEDILEITNSELQSFFKDSKTVLEINKQPRKYSEIFHEFMKPAIIEVFDDEKSLKKILDWGEFVWNKAVADKFPNNTKSKDIEILFPLFKNTTNDPTLIAEFLDRKRNLFYGDNFFIVKQTSLLDTTGRLSISIAVLPIEE